MKPPAVKRAGQRLASPPVRGRGLKRAKTTACTCPALVAPRARAWIETAQILKSIPLAELRRQGRSYNKECASWAPWS